jgi:glutamate/aspartate transport system substrate-binding protein
MEHRKSKMATLLFAVIVFTGVATPAIAQDGTLSKIRKTGTITLGHRDASIPFSYYDDNQQPVGYTIELCQQIVEAVRTELGLPKIDIKYQLVTASNRIPLMANGTIDLECGSTTNTLERQKQVGFSITHFITANRWIARKASNISTLEDMKGKTIVSAAGTTNLQRISELNVQRNLGMNIISANGLSEGFQMVESGRAAAFVMDDILLYGLAAQSRNPAEFVISAEALSVEPYGIMMRKDDVAFKKVVDSAMANIYRSGRVKLIYDKWFLQAIPPRSLNLNIPMSAQLKRAVANPTDSGDPSSYSEGSSY